MATLEHDHLVYETHPHVYVPSDDTFLLMEALHPRPGQRVLEVGCGAGLVSLHARRSGARVVASDVNPAAVRLTKTNARRNRMEVDVVLGDLFHPFRPDAFHTIVFNPPYLPTRPHERVPGTLNRAFDGGHDGLATTRRFLDGLRQAPATEVLLVGSSLQGPERLIELAARARRSAQPVRTQAFNFETLTVYRLAKAPHPES